MKERLEAAIKAYGEACASVDACGSKVDAAAAAIAELDDNASEDTISKAETELKDAEASLEQASTDATAAKAEQDRLQRLYNAREQHKPLPATDPQPATARGSLKSESTYRPDQPQVSFFRDLLAVRAGDGHAAERLATNRAEALDALGFPGADMSDSATAGHEFLPPLYLADLWVEPAIAARPFADALPKMPLPPYGTAISIPQLSSGVSVAARSDGGTVSETDGVTASITHDVNEIAGQVDIGRIAVMRSQPGLDTVIGRTLVRRYNAYLDTQLLSGSGTAPQHRGIRAVSGVNTVAYTDGSPTAAELFPKIYDAIQQIATNRIEEVADLIVFHPRRTAWLASNLSSTFPLFQQDALMQAGGKQDKGFVTSFGGLKVIADPNIGTTYGASTNEDEVYVVASNDLILQEGPLMARVFEDVGSGSGNIRYQVFAHSAFLSKRYPKSITVVSGTGLVSPTF